MMTPYPFERTVCACRDCAVSCEHVPGALSPDDLPRLARQQGYGDDVERFATECLSVSDGAKVQTTDGRVISLPTLVPAARENGHCHWLLEGRCAVHAASPYGCALFDAHMTDVEYRTRADHLYALLFDDQLAGGPYTRLCGELTVAGRATLPLAKRREGLIAAMQADRRPRDGA